MKVAYKPNSNGGGEQTPLTGVIHAMGQFIDTDGIDYYATEWLEKLGLSAHFLVDPSGVIIKTREVNQVGWHAKGYNVNTVGIEILVPGLHDYASFLEAIKTDYVNERQYAALIELCRSLKLPKWKRHSDISPDRKFDPGSGFDWGRFLSDIE